MTAFLTFLAHLDATDWLLILTAWVLVAYALGTFTGLGIALADRRRPKPEPLPEPEDDGEWLGFWPAGDDDEVRVRLEQIAAAEGWNPITEDWAA